MKSPSSLSLVRKRDFTEEEPPEPAAGKTGHGLEIDVIFTSAASTAAAMQTAVNMAARTGARITMVVPYIVPFPAPLTSPPVLLDWNENRLRRIAEKSGVETSVQVYLCRDRLQTLLGVLMPRSFIVMGGRRRRWWPTREERLARELQRAGHEVAYTGTD